MNEVAGLDLVAIANQRFSVGLEREAIAASENAQGAQSLEAGGQPGNAVPAIEDIMFEGQPRALGEVFEANAGVLELGRAGRPQPLGEPVEVHRGLRERRAPRLRRLRWE